MSTIQTQKIPIPGVKKIITIASGKGGVGKSSISAYLAAYLSNKNYKVGLIDADIYGPSIAKLLNIEDFLAQSQDGKIIPAVVEKIKVISISFLTDNKGAFAWRGPMVGKAIAQLFSSTLWGDLDYLIVDTPPGTGDIHLSILGSYKIDGVFIVTTGSQISCIDVERCIDLHQKFNTKFYGIIENMSYYANPISKKKIPLFGQGGGKLLSEKFGIPLIDQLELVPNLADIKFCDLLKTLKINLNNIDL